MKKLAITFMALTLLCLSASATILYVPSQYGFIQDAVNAAAVGDTIMVAAGTYFENVVINQGLYLFGEDMVTTTIDAGGDGRAVTITGVAGSVGAVRGFALTHTGSGISGSYACCGLLISSSGSGNWDVSWNLFIDNPDIGYLSFDGGAVHHCIFENNGFNGDYRRGVMASSSSSLNIENNDFRNNYQAIYAHAAAGFTTVKNNIVADNQVGIYLNNSSNSISYNDVWNNATNYQACSPGIGDISQDPLYVGGAPFDYHLSAGSPCIDAGDPSSPYDPDGTRADMGVYYFQQGTPSFLVDLTYVSGSPIPPAGGDLYFEVYVENEGTTAYSLDAWIDIAYAGGVPQTVIQRHLDDFQPGWTINRPDMFYPIPSNYPAGNYCLYGRVGTYPTPIWEDDSITFDKSGTDIIEGFLPFAVAGVPDPFETVESFSAAVVEEFSTLTSYPNPFNPETHLTFSLTNSGQVSLIVYDVSGREVARLLDGFLNMGTHDAIFDASHLPSGIYFARLSADNQVQTQRLLLLK
ncbi:MAG: T9SS type A sorting domain-containing protein [bacterium]